ncbi:WG repeat-containing protein [bacterium]|nr:WG repeat-containing protein [bacterium]
MKKLALIFTLLMFSMIHACNAAEVYEEDGKFGLRESKNGQIITEAKYKKLVRLGNSSWILQSGVKFGILADNGDIIVEPKYNQAERVLGKFAKFAKGEKYGIYDEMGFTILPVEYSSIDLLYGGMFVTCKNYKYGITDLNGQVILDNIFDDIYMPDFNTMVFVYGGQVMEITRDPDAAVSIPYDIQSIHEDLNALKFTDIASNPITSTGYYSVTVTDYILKLISSISPAYEETIDELMFSQGADTVNVLMRFGWLPKFPFVYAKKYYKNVKNPYSGPLSGIKKNLKLRMKD